MGFFDRQSSQRGGFFSAPAAPADPIARELDRVQDVAALAQIPEPEDRPSPIERVIDVISRPLFGVAGFAEEMYVNGGTLGDGLRRLGREVFSGLGGLEGDKKDFTALLSEAGIAEGGHVSQIAPFLFNEGGEGWKFARGGAADLSARDLAGIALNAAADPLTYVSFGSGRAATQLLRSPLARKTLAEGITDPTLRRMVLNGRVPLSKAGKEIFEQARMEGLSAGQRRAFAETLEKLGVTEAEAVEKLSREAAGQIAAGKTGFEAVREAFEVIRPARFEKWTPDKALQATVDVTLRADELAGEAAFRRVISQAQLQGGLIEPGGLKFFGQTLIGRRAFEPIVARTSRFINSIQQTPLGRQVAAGLRSIDAIFNASRKAARRIPGFEVARATFRTEVGQLDNQLRQTIEELVPKSWAKQTVDLPDGQRMRLDHYVSRFLDNPQQYPAERLPGPVAEQAIKIKSLVGEWVDAETRFGLLDAGRARPNALPHMFRNSRDQLEQLVGRFDARRGVDPAKGLGVTGWRETRAFRNLDEAEAFARELRQGGSIDFDLDPVLDLREVLFRRGNAHNRVISMHRFETNLMSSFGLAKEALGEHVFRRTLPEYEALVRRQILAGEKPHLTVESMQRVGEALSEQTGKALRTADEKAAYLMGRGRQASSLEQFEAFLKADAQIIDEAAPGIQDAVHRQAGLHRQEYLNSFREPMQEIASGPMRGIVMPLSIAEEVARMGQQLFRDREMGRMLKIYDTATNLFKLGVTGAWPAFINRNAYSNTAANFVEIGLAAFDPLKAVRAGRIIAGGDGTLLARGGRRYTYGEIRAMAKRFGVLPETTGVLELNTQGWRLDSTMSKISHGIRVPNELVEKEARMVLFAEKLAQGLDPAEAAHRVARVLFDYGSLSTTERGVLRRIFPFYTWMSKNVRLQAENLIREPGRLFATQKVAAGSLAERGPERDVLPEYLRGEFKVKLNTQGGNSKAFLTGLDLPFGSAIETLFGTSTRNVAAIHINSMNPMLTMLVEHATGRDLWTGRSIAERQHLRTFGEMLRAMPGPGGSAFRGWLEFREDPEGPEGEKRYSINGTKAHFFIKSFAFSRIFSTTEGFARLAADTGKAGAMLDFLTGLEFKEFDMNEAQRAHTRARLKRLEQELLRRGVVRQFERTFVPKESALGQRLAVQRQQEKARKRRGGGLFR